MAGHTKGPWAFWDECGATPNNCCEPWAGADDLVREAYDEEGNHIGEMVLTVCEKILEESKACEKCDTDGAPCAGVLRISKADALLVAAAPDLYDALVAIEWTGPAGTCPSCKARKDEGHTEECTVGKSLTRARGTSS